MFPDAKSADGGLPHFSDGSRDDLMQSAYLRAMQIYYEMPENHPRSPHFSGGMVNTSRVFYWAWDARPYPAFPYRLDVWSDGRNWHTGHWLNGRDAGAPLAALLAGLGARGARGAQLENIRGHIEGYALRGVSDAAQDMAPLLTAFGIDALVADDRLRLAGRGDKPVRAIAAADILPGTDGAPAVQRGQKPLDKLPNRFDLHFLDAAGDYGASHTSARFEAGEQPVARLNLPVAIGRGLAQVLATRLLHMARGEHEHISMRLPLSYLDVEIGDVVGFDDVLWRVTELTHGHVLELSATRHQPHIFSGYRVLEDDDSRPASSGVAARPELDIIELPAPALLFVAAGGDAPLVASFAAPWPQSVQLRREGAAPLLLGAPSIMGDTLTALPAGPVGRWDAHSLLEVRFYGGTIASLPRSEVLAGGNRLAVKTPRGWEVIQFATAELVGDDHYKLSGLLRGQFGSDAAQVSNLAKGARCIMLSAAQVPLAPSLDRLPPSFAYRFGPPSLPQDGYGWQAGQYEIRHAALACLAPVHARLTWPQGFAADWRIDWVRRSRVGGDDFQAPETPLGEAREVYQLTLQADGSPAQNWQTPTPHTDLSALQRRQLRRANSGVRNWQLSIAQINDRGEADAPLEISLPMNEEPQ